MITRIGLVAGDIWNYLDRNNGSADMGRMVEDLGTERDIVLMSLGWLAREGHIFLHGDNEKYSVSLQK